MKSGFISIFGRPNAGKSTPLNALMGEKLAIVSPKAQTTRHRIKGILSGPGYQLIFSDTPGIIEPRYRLHEKMMQVVKGALEDADLALLIVDVTEDPQQADAIFSALQLRSPALLVLNKTDAAGTEQIQRATEFFQARPYVSRVLAISAQEKLQMDALLEAILERMPEGEPFFDEEQLTDLPTRFFVGEMIREKIFLLYKDEIPYHSTVLVTAFQEKQTLIKIEAVIVVQRESQKGILLGGGGKMIRELGTQARKDIEAFLGSKVFLELFVKVRPRWRDNDLLLKEYGYQ